MKVTRNEVDTPDEVCGLFNTVFEQIGQLRATLEDLAKQKPKKTSKKEADK